MVTLIKGKKFFPMVCQPNTFPPFINLDFGRGGLRFFILLILLGCILIFSSPLAAQEPEKLTVAPAGSATWNDHLIFQQNNPEYGKEPKIVPFMPRPEPREIGEVQNLSGAVAFLEPKLQIAEKSPLIPVSNGFQALPDPNTSIPPDTMGAVGPNHLMTMLNTEVRIQNKTGTNIGATVTLTTWWTSGTGLNGDPFDPMIIFDSLTGRWMAMVDANGGDLTSSATWFAVSDTYDPTGSWTYYSFNMESPNNNALWHDYPDIGTNQHWIALTNNMFSASTFSGLGLIAIDKTTLGGGLTAYIWPQGYDNWGSYSGFTLRPALTFDPAEDVLYMVDGNYWQSAGIGLFRLSRITGVPPAVPVWSIVPDSAGISPGSGFFLTPQSYNLNQINASQLGTTTLVQTNDSRLQNAVFRTGRLWTTHSGGLPFSGTADRTVVCWYQIDPLLLNTQANPTVQSGTLDGGPDVHYFLPSITANMLDDVALGFSHSHSGIYVEAAVTGRKGTDPAGTMDPIRTIKAGEDSYVKDFGSGRVRWGDYSATVVDPADDTTFWTIQEYAAMDVGSGASDDRWGTWWAMSTYSPHRYGNELAVDFGTAGLYIYDAGWSKLSSWDVDDNGGLSGCWQGGLAADFGSNGLYNYKGLSWSKLSTWNVDTGGMSGWMGGLAIDFGSSGLYNYYYGSWSKLSNWNVDDNGGLSGWTGGLAVDFGSNGLYNHDGSSWSKLSTWNVDTGGLSGWIDGLAIDFGSNGLYSYNGSWSKLSNWDVDDNGGLSGWTGGLAVDFGANGLYSYDGSSWTKLSSWNAEGLSAYGSNLAVDFGSNGLYSYDGTSWSKMSSWDSENLADSGPDSSF